MIFISVLNIFCLVFILNSILCQNATTNNTLKVFIEGNINLILDFEKNVIIIFKVVSLREVVF